MRRLRCLWILAWMAVFPDVGHADPPDPSPPDPVQQVSLLRQNPLAQFQLLLGRPQLDAVRYRKGSQTQLLSPNHHLGDSHSVLRESLSTTSYHGQPTLHYTLVSDTVKVTIDIASSGTWTIDSQRRIGGDLQRVWLTQPSHQPLQLVCQSELPELRLQASTWLHLREADRVVFDTHLLPIIEQMIAPHRFEKIAEAAHSHAVQDNRESIFDQQQIEKLIAHLSSTQRHQRVLAYQELSSMGLAIVPLLDNLDVSRLDAEQRARVLLLRQQFQSCIEDSPERLATLLKHDTGYWKLASSRMNEKDRILVANRFNAAGMSSPLPLEPNVTRVATAVRD